MPVSNPAHGASASGFSDPGSRPPSSCQLTTWVAPFQLAYALSCPGLEARTVTAGFVAGWPIHG